MNTGNFNAKWLVLAIPPIVAIAALCVIGLGHVIHPAWVGEQPDTAGYIQKAYGLLTDAAHATAELFYSTVENIVVLVVGFIWGKRMIRREHLRLDSEHGIKHDETR